MSNKFNFQEAREKAIKAADQELEQGLKQIAEGAKGSGTAAPSKGEEDTSGTGTSVPSGIAHVEPVSAVSAAATVKKAMEVEPTQNINIPIPLNQHMRLAVIKAHTRQNIKDLVVQAIGLWLDVQEGKKNIINSNHQ